MGACGMNCDICAVCMKYVWHLCCVSVWCMCHVIVLAVYFDIRCFLHWCVHVEYVVYDVCVCVAYVYQVCCRCYVYVMCECYVCCM